MIVLYSSEDQADRFNIFIRKTITFYKLLFVEFLEYHVVPHTEYSAGIYNREPLRTLDTHHYVIRLGVSSKLINVKK